MPKGYVVTRKRVDMRRSAIADIRHFCLGKPENKKGIYWWETIPFNAKEHKEDSKKHQTEFDNYERTKREYYEALIEVVENEKKILRWMFVKGKRSMKDFVRKELRVFEEESGGKLTEELLKHELLRLKITKRNDRIMNAELADIEEVGKAIPKEGEIEYKFKAEMAEEKSKSVERVMSVRKL